MNWNSIISNNMEVLMLTSKQRAYLRGLANTINPTTTIGKEGITESLLSSIEETFNTRELVKISILDTAGLDTKESAESIAKALNAESVQAIGSKIVLYKKCKDNPKIVLPRK